MPEYFINRNMKKYILCCMPVLFLLLAGCTTEIRARKTGRSLFAKDYSIFEMYRRHDLNYDTVNFLALHDLTGEFAENPKGVLQKLYRHGPETEDRQVRRVIADLSFHQAHRVKDPAEQASYYLLTAQTAWDALFSDRDALREEIWMWYLYNQSVLKLFEFAKDRKILLNSSYSMEPVCGANVFFTAPEKQMESLPDPEHAEPCAEWKPYNNQVFTSRRGLGVPLVVRKSASPEKSELRNVLIEPATAVLRFENTLSESGCRNARWEFIDTMKYSRFTVNGITAPLAMDITTPLACAMNKPDPFRSIYAMFRPDRMENLSGLYLTQPWDPEKIPVVMTHGLMSNPRTWAQMLNSLYLDPRIRKHYQFWFFAYPSGNPILYSAHQLRSALQTAEQKYGKDSKSFHQMVLIGHSMGGLLSKAVITDTGDELEKFLLQGNEKKLQKLTPENRKKLEEMLTFRNPDYVKRVVFLATPHRGSEIANWKIVSSWVAKSITLPSKMYQLMKENLTLLGMLPDKDDIYIRTGVDNLAPDDRILNKLNELNFRTVPFHSVIGNEDADQVPGGSDGVVPYTSSHLDGAASELIVKSGHSIQQQPKAIVEVKRILIQHLIESGRLPAHGNEDKTK